MDRENLVGRRAFDRENDPHGGILDVHLHMRPQTAKSLPDGWAEDDATWVNLSSLHLLDPDKKQGT